MKYKGKVFYCSDNHLFNGSSNSGHYVLVTEEMGNKVLVRQITSLEQKPYVYKNNKLNHTRNGLLKPIPMNETNLKKWSAFENNLLLVDKSNLKKTKVKIKKTNYFFK